MIPVPDLANDITKPSADQPLLNVAMPYSTIFFPLGFPVEVRTNSLMCSKLQHKAGANSTISLMSTQS